MASRARLPPMPVAQPVPALAHGDLLGSARRRDHVRAILGIRVEAAARTDAIPALGGANGDARACRRLEKTAGPLLPHVDAEGVPKAPPKLPRNVPGFFHIGFTSRATS